MRMIKQVLILSFVLTACGPLNQPEPQSSSQATPTPGATGLLPSPIATPVSVATRNVNVLLQDSSNQLIANATVELSSANQGSQVFTSNAEGQVRLPLLRVDTEYQLSVKASGYVNTSRTLNLSKLPIQAQSDPLVAIVLERARATLSGRVLNQNGAPLAGASVFDGTQSQTTASDGRFSFAYQQAQTLQLSVSKSGFQGALRSVRIEVGKDNALGDFTLSPLNRTLKVGLKSDTLLLNQYQSLKEAIIEQGYQVVEISSVADQLSQIDVLIWLSPSQLENGVSSRIQNWLSGGNKLIVSGEWAGFAGFHVDVANTLLSPYHLAFSGDTLRDQESGYVNVGGFINHPVTQGISQVKLYQSGSVKLLSSDQNGAVLARSSATSFQILDNTGAFGVLAVSSYGTGKAIVIGDSSLWSGQDSDGNGTPNIREAQNRQLFSQILSW